MKYPQDIYAEALSEVLAAPLSLHKEKQVIKNFLSLVQKNNDGYLLKKIIDQTEKRLRARTGVRRVVIETARPQYSLKTKLSSLIRESDIVEEKITPELLAGMRVTIDETMEFDNTLKRKIDKLFRNLYELRNY